jgi:hypothetical protein
MFMLACAGVEQLAAQAAPSPPGSLVDVGGYRVHLNCVGTGRPTVVIVGSGYSIDWTLVQGPVSSFTRVCTYDPSGSAWSDRGPETTCDSRVSELHRVLHKGGVDDPIVLTGHSIGAVWAELKAESARQKRSIFETSTVMAVSAARALPGGVRWLSSTARVGAVRTGAVFAAALLDHYRETLREIREVGYLTYAGRQFRPYLRAAAGQFSPQRRTLTQRLLEKLAARRRDKI